MNTTTIVHPQYGEVHDVWYEAPHDELVGYWYKRVDGVLCHYYAGVGWKEKSYSDCLEISFSSEEP